MMQRLQLAQERRESSEPNGRRVWTFSDKTSESCVKMERADGQSTAWSYSMLPQEGLLARKIG